MRVILLAAGVGKRFGKRTKKLPKCLIPLGRPGYHLLSRYLESFRTLGLADIVVVIGHENKKIKKACAQHGAGLNIRFVLNPSYKKGSIYSLFKASKFFDSDILIMDADVYFSTRSLGKLLKSRQKTCFLLDRKSRSGGEEMMLMAKNGRPVRIAKKVDPFLKILGEATGIFRAGKKDALKLKKILSKYVKLDKVYGEYEESYCDLMKSSKVGSVSIDDFWTEMDFEEDLQKIIRREKIRP